MSQRSERIGWHRVDAVSLVAGLAAVAIALASLLDLDLDGDIVVPVLIVAAGLVGLLVTLRRSGDEEHDPAP